ncbi:hypothetical protein ACHAQJ_002517 [Trichoderma viride]
MAEMRFQVNPILVEEVRLRAKDNDLSLEKLSLGNTSLGTLGGLAERCYGPVDQIQGMSARETAFFRGFFNWFRLVHLVGSGHGYVLDKGQRRTYHMLLDWWSATYYSPRPNLFFLLSSLRFIVSEVIPLNDADVAKFIYVPKGDGETWERLEKCPFKLQFWQEEKNTASIVQELKNCISTYLQFLGTRHDFVFQTIAQLGAMEFGQDSLHPDEISDYDRIMWRLFLSQFCDMEDGEGQGLVAAGEAYYHDTEFLVMRNLDRGKPLEMRADVKIFTVTAPENRALATSTKHDLEICMFEATNFEWPHILEQGFLAEGSLAHGLTKDAFDNWPLYLWHQSDARLVKVRDIAIAVGNLPAYTAISHAGRHDEEVPGYVIPNGWEFPVPSNDRFRAEDLPRDLREADGEIETEYVWMDLLCLPQCKVDDEGQENGGEKYHLKLMEISRQSTIFRSATRVVVWPLN